MSAKKIALLKVVASSFGEGVSLRGPKGRGEDDPAQKHLTEAGFVPGEDVVVIPLAEYDRLTDLAFRYEALYD